MKDPWQSISSSQVYANPWITLTEHRVINPNGGKGIYGLVHFKNLAIGILALDTEGQIYLVGQSRFPISQYSWEIPEGGGPLADDPLESAKRELVEETGLVASQWRELQRLYLSNSVTDELGIIYLATGLTLGEAHPEETERLVLQKVHTEKAYEMVCSGEITDSISIIAILRLKILLEKAEWDPENLVW